MTSIIGLAQRHSSLFLLALCFLPGFCCCLQALNLLEDHDDRNDDNINDDALQKMMSEKSVGKSLRDLIRESKMHI